MGMIYESERMQEEAKEILKKAGAYKVLSTEVNATTDLSLCVLPFKFDIVLGGKTILSLDKVENAYIIYNVLCADLKGKVYHG